MRIIFCQVHNDNNFKTQVSTSDRKVKDSAPQAVQWNILSCNTEKRDCAVTRYLTKIYELCAISKSWAAPQIWFGEQNVWISHRVTNIEYTCLWIVEACMRGRRWFILQTWVFSDSSRHQTLYNCLLLFFSVIRDKEEQTVVKVESSARIRDNLGLQKQLSSAPHAGTIFLWRLAIVYSLYTYNSVLLA